MTVAERQRWYAERHAAKLNRKNARKGLIPNS
jgi:hypothetical protein